MIIYVHANANFDFSWRLPYTLKGLDAIIDLTFRYFVCRANVLPVINLNSDLNHAVLRGLLRIENQRAMISSGQSRMTHVLFEVALCLLPALRSSADVPQILCEMWASAVRTLFGANPLLDQGKPLEQIRSVKNVLVVAICRERSSDKK